MSTISVFAFERQFLQLAGPFHQIHMQSDCRSRQLAWEAMWSLPAVHAIVAYVRPDGEISQNLSAVVNDPAVLNFVDNQFATAPKNAYVLPPVRKGPIRTSYKTWGDALAIPETKMNDPNAHQNWELINTISIDFHCNTYWLLSALNGTITIYVFYFLDATGHPQVRIEGFSDPVWDEQPWRPDYGAAGQVSAALVQGLVNDQPFLQFMLDNALRNFSGSGAFSDLYVLPGTGVTAGAPLDDDADNNVALCLVPKT
jgi:hypothetical protein